MRRLGVRLQRGRLRVHSPDPAYDAKVARIGRAVALARAHPTRVRTIYGDEVGIYRQPTLGARWAPVGEEPIAELAPGSDLVYRIGGGLDVVDGRVVRVSGIKVGVERLKRFLRALRRANPQRYLFLIWDNWPVHQHDAVLAEAKAQRIHLLWLPTYAPWENPIEKLWRWLKQTLLHHHAGADDWAALKAAVLAWLDQFAPGSDELLRYVGLGAA